MRHLKQLFIRRLPKDEIRRGWIRIDKSTRGNIEYQSLIILKSKNHAVERIVLGIDDDGKDSKNSIFMDESTREKLNLQVYNPKERYKFEIISPNFLIKLWHKPCFYWQHPDFPIGFASKIAIISLLLSLLSITYSIFR